MILALGAAGVFYYVRQREREELREAVGAARAQMRGGGGRYGGGGAHGYGPGSAEDDEDWWSDVEDEDESDRGAGPSAAGADDGLPETLEEACALLNVTPETPKDEVNRIYTAMARVWHPDKATSDADRKRREAKMKQLNAARDMILGR